MTALTRPCPSGCGRHVLAGHLMCGPCWREVPRHLQRDVYRTWRAYRLNQSTTTRKAYVDARDAALGAVP